MSVDIDRPTARSAKSPSSLSERRELFIHGEWVRPSSGEWFATRDPSNGEVLAEIARGNAEDVDRAVRDAHVGFRTWSGMLPAERARLLVKIAGVLRDSRDLLAELESLDNGKPLTQAYKDVEITARYFEFFGGAADKIMGETIPLGDDYLAYTRREPYGVIAAILPWNVPMNQAGRALAPALAGGNSVVVKPAEDTSLTCLEIVRIAHECGMPPGVLNVVTGLGREAGQALAEHELVRKIAFTGSVVTGQHLMRLAADRMVPLTLELGGKSANIVLPDADLEATALNTAKSINHNAGQICSTPSRLVVLSSVHDELVERLVELDRNVTLGPGVEDPDMGPITTAAQFAKVQAYLETGRREGAKIATGGKVSDDERLRNGQFVLPTVFVGVEPGMKIAQEEIFGPVLSVIKAGSVDEAIEIANGTAFGLAAGIWTRDISSAHRIAARLEAGQVFVNEWFAGGVETPFGGYKASGFGREKGLEALQHYTQVKSVNIRL
jgi:aldehyde dehydrogenase (NAD+)